MIKRLVTVGILVFAVGCGGKSATTGTSGTGFGPEGGEGGLGGRPGTGSGAEGSGDLRTVYFDFDDYSLRADAKQDLQHNANVLLGNRGLNVEIQGNCDERGTEAYNLALGKKRAEAAKRYLVDLGVEAARMSTISFGEENPAAPGSTEAAWAQNRRDEFVVR